MCYYCLDFARLSQNGPCSAVSPQHLNMDFLLFRAVVLRLSVPESETVSTCDPSHLIWFDYSFDLFSQKEYLLTWRGKTRIETIVSVVSCCSPELFTCTYLGVKIHSAWCNDSITAVHFVSHDLFKFKLNFSAICAGLAFWCLFVKNIQRISWLHQSN